MVVVGEAVMGTPGMEAARPLRSVVSLASGPDILYSIGAQWRMALLHRNVQVPRAQPQFTRLISAFAGRFTASLRSSITPLTTRRA